MYSLLVLGKELAVRNTECFLLEFWVLQLLMQPSFSGRSFNIMNIAGYAQVHMQRQTNSLASKETMDKICNRYLFHQNPPVLFHIAAYASDLGSLMKTMSNED